MVYPWLEPLQRQLANQYQQNTLHHALLISGAQGMGKREFAIELAQGLLCERKMGVACGQCKSCLLHQTQAHPDFYIAQDPDAKSIGVDLIRQVVSKAQQKSQLGGASVYYIPDCEKMTDASANALLKTLEEPGKGKFLILTTQAANRLLPTIISRCQQYQLRPPKEAELVSWVSQQGVDANAFFEIYQSLNGSPLIALGHAKSDYLEQYNRYLADFKQLITGRMAAFEFSQNFDESQYSQQLNWLSQATAKWLSAKLANQSKSAEQALKSLIISDILSLIARTKAQMLQSGINKKMLYQSLCFKLVDKLRN